MEIEKINLQLEPRLIINDKVVEMGEHRTYVVHCKSINRFRGYFRSGCLKSGNVYMEFVVENSNIVIDLLNESDSWFLDNATDIDMIIPINSGEFEYLISNWEDEKELL